MTNVDLENFNCTLLNTVLDINLNLNIGYIEFKVVAVQSESQVRLGLYRLNWGCVGVLQILGWIICGTILNK